MDERTLVAKIKGDEKESFVFITVTSAFKIARMSYPALTESDLRAALHKMGFSDAEIKDLIEHARSHPV